MKSENFSSRLYKCVYFSNNCVESANNFALIILQKYLNIYIYSFTKFYI
jgi:hypothetical protein